MQKEAFGHLVNLGSVGSSSGDYGVVFKDGHIESVPLTTINPGVTCPDQESQTSYRGTAVFISARSNDYARAGMKHTCILSNICAVEATFPEVLIRSSRLVDEWIAGLSLARLMTANVVLHTMDIGIYGCMELVFANLLGLPVGTNLDDLLSKPEINLMDPQRLRHLYSLLTSHSQPTILECIRNHSNWLNCQLSIDLDDTLAQLNRNTSESLDQTTLGELILKYLNEPDDLLDLSQRWIVKRLEPLLRLFPNTLLERYLINPNYGPQLHVNLDGAVFDGTGIVDYVDFENDSRPDGFWYLPEPGVYAYAERIDDMGFDYHTVPGRTSTIAPLRKLS